MADDGQDVQDPKDPTNHVQDPKDPPKQRQDPKDPDEYLEELRKQAGQDGTDVDGQEDVDDHARLVEALREQELTKARLEAVSQAYVDLLKQGRPEVHGDAPDFDDIIKQSRKAGGTFYGGKE